MRFIYQKLLLAVEHCTWFSRFIWDMGCKTTLWVLGTSTKETYLKAVGTKQGETQQMFSRTFPCWNLCVALQYEERRTRRMIELLSCFIYDTQGRTRWCSGGETRWHPLIDSSQINVQVQGYAASVNGAFQRQITSQWAFLRPQQNVLRK